VKGSFDLEAAFREAVVVAALSALPFLAAGFGARHPFLVALNLGPWDGPYVQGFARDHEVNDKVGTHWTSYDATVLLPVAVRGEALKLSYRYARVFPQTALVRVFFAGRQVDEFQCRGGRFEERQVAVSAPDATRVEVRFVVDSHEGQSLGLNLDWVRLSSSGAGEQRLTAGARLRPLLLVALFALLLRQAGWGRRSAALLAAPVAAAATVGLMTDPWLTHRLLTGVPEALAAFGLAGIALGRVFEARGRLAREDLRALAALAMTAFLLRAVAINHPDFYYPDLMTHARLVETIRDAGLDFFSAPARYVDAQGAWTKPTYGATSGLPYAVGFHLLFVPWRLSYDALLTAEKLVGAGLSTVPIVCLWLLSRRLGLRPLGAALLIAVPTYTSRLTFALLPALTGHALDMAFLLWLAGHYERLREPRVLLSGAAFMAACEVAYVSSVTNLCLFVAAFAFFVVVEAREDRLARAGRIVAMGLGAALLAVLVYYRAFLGAAAGLIARVLGDAHAAPSLYPAESWLLLTYTRTRDFFDGVYPFLALLGLVLLFRRERARALAGAWLATYLLLLLLRAKVPDVFRYGHETLLVTPLVCLASGEALSVLASRGGWRRLVAAGLLVFLAGQGFLWQWRALDLQLGNAL
jgi:hypothetical protein